MKNLLLTLSLMAISFVQGQTLDDVVVSHIQPTSTTEQLRQGLEKIETLCSTDKEKCNKAKGYAYYLLADDYYGAAYEVFSVDEDLAAPILNRAKEMLELANKHYPESKLTEVQKNVLMDSKHKLEALDAYTEYISN